VVALRQPATRHPGLHRFFQGATWLWAGIFLLLTVGLAALMVTEPAGTFLMLSPSPLRRSSPPEPAYPHSGSSQCCAGSGVHESLLRARSPGRRRLTRCREGRRWP
jgi:hypothetical protein